MSVANYQKNRALFSKDQDFFLRRIGLFSQKRPSNGRVFSLQRALSLKRDSLQGERRASLSVKKDFSLCRETNHERSP